MNKNMKIILGSALLLISGFAYAKHITIINNTDYKVKCEVSTSDAKNRNNHSEHSVDVNKKQNATLDTKYDTLNAVSVSSSEKGIRRGDWSANTNANATEFTIGLSDQNKLTISAQ